MRESIISIIVAVFAIFVSTAFAQDGKITVEILGIKEIKGRISMALYNKSEDFPETDKSYKGVFVKVTKETVKYTFSNIPNGYYAIAVYHDSNSNNKLDKNFLGIPKEGYAFSKNVFGIIGPPSFYKAKFKLSDTYTAKIKMKY